MNLQERRNLCLISAGASGAVLACAALAEQEGFPTWAVILLITLALAFASCCVYFITHGNGGGRA